jgi:hypothetical protein
MATVRPSKRGVAPPRFITLELKQFEKIEKLVMVLGRHVLGEQEVQEILGRVAREATTTPEDTLRDAGISTTRAQARYQRRLSSLLAGRE